MARADCESQYKDAVPITLEQIDVIKRFLDSNSDDFQLVTTVEGAYINMEMAYLKKGVTNVHYVLLRVTKFANYC